MAHREHPRSKNKFVGEYGEKAVADFVRSQGATVVDQNWRINEGEIDIVSRLANGTIAFIEVKTRTSAAFGHPLEAINSQKAHRLQRLALAWLATHQSLGYPYRIDCAAVIIESNGKFTIDYRENIL
jgi:putative endonuclease